LEELLREDTEVFNETDRFDAVRGVLNGSDIEVPKGRGFQIKKGHVPESPMDNTPKST